MAVPCSRAAVGVGCTCSCTSCVANPIPRDMPIPHNDDDPDEFLDTCMLQPWELSILVAKNGSISAVDIHVAPGTSVQELDRMECIRLHCIVQHAVKFVRAAVAAGKRPDQALSATVLSDDCPTLHQLVLKYDKPQMALLARCALAMVLLPRNLDQLSPLPATTSRACFDSVLRAVTDGERAADLLA